MEEHNKVDLTQEMPSAIEMKYSNETNCMKKQSATERTEPVKKTKSYSATRTCVMRAVPVSVPSTAGVTTVPLLLPSTICVTPRLSLLPLGLLPSLLGKAFNARFKQPMLKLMSAFLRKFSERVIQTKANTERKAKEKQRRQDRTPKTSVEDQNNQKLLATGHANEVNLLVSTSLR